MPENPSKKMLAHCLSEIGRLEGQDYFKANDVLLDDLAKVLARHADDAEHATKMITAWKSRTRQMLHESDIPELADRTANRGTLPKGCSKCLGTDFIIVEHSGGTGVRRCECVRGRALAKLDQERESARRNDPAFSSLPTFTGNEWKN